MSDVAFERKCPFRKEMVELLDKGSVLTTAQPKQDEAMFDPIAKLQVTVEQLEQLWKLYTADGGGDERQRRRRDGHSLDGESEV